jgi:hypothetical protein
MYFNFNNDFVAQANEELKDQLQSYRQALRTVQPFAVLKSIQSNINYLRHIIREFNQQGQSDFNRDRIL